MKTTNVRRGARIHWAPPSTKRHFNPDDEYTTKNGAAEFLHCSTKNIDRQVAAKVLRKYRFGKRVLLKISELRAAIQPVE